MIFTHIFAENNSNNATAAADSVDDNDSTTGSHSSSDPVELQSDCLLGLGSGRVTTALHCDGRVLAGLDSSQAGHEAVFPKQEQFVDGRAQCKGTMKSTSFALRTFHVWRRDINMGAGREEIPTIQRLCYDVRPGSAAPGDTDRLQQVLLRFFREARKKDGELYPPLTLKGMLASIWRHMRQDMGVAPELNLTDAARYPDFNRQFRDHCARLHDMGYGKVKRRAEIITAALELEMWDKGVLGGASLLSARNTIFYYLSKFYGLRSFEDHSRVSWEHVKLDRVPRTNAPYLHFSLRPPDLGRCGRRTVEARRFLSEELYEVFQQYATGTFRADPFYRKVSYGNNCYLPEKLSDYAISTYVKNMMSTICKGVFFANNSIRRAPAAERSAVLDPQRGAIPGCRDAKLMKISCELMNSVDPGQSAGPEPGGGASGVETDAPGGASGHDSVATLADAASVSVSGATGSARASVATAPQASVAKPPANSPGSLSTDSSVSSQAAPAALPNLSINIPFDKFCNSQFEVVLDRYKHDYNISLTIT